MARWGVVRAASLGTWASWLFATVVLLYEARIHLLHPWPLPIVAAMLLCLACGATLLVALAAAVRRGRARWRSFGVAAFGIVPCVLFCAQIRCADHARFQESGQGWGRTVAATMTANLLGARLAWEYDTLMETPHVVVYGGEGASTSADAWRMEAFVAAMERRLGRSLPARIYWLRGRVAHRDGASVPGFALGTFGLPLAASHDAAEYHEMSHAVMDAVTSPAADPPCFLVEGWALSQSGTDRRALYRRAVRARLAGEGCRLAALTQPSAWRRRDREAEAFGGAFVDFAIRRYGMRPFLALYENSRQGTFEQAVKRAFGDDQATVEARFWDEAGRQVPQPTARRIHIPEQPMPRHNARDCFIRAAVLAGEADDIPQARAVLRQGFRHPYREVSLRRFGQLGAPYRSYTVLVHRLCHLSDQLRAEGRPAEAADTAMDVIRFAVEIRHGAPLRAVVASGRFVQMGQARLMAALPQLTPSEARERARRLASISARWVPLEENAREEMWTQQASMMALMRQANWRQRLAKAVDPHLPCSSLTGEQLLADYTEYMYRMVGALHHTVGALHRSGRLDAFTVDGPLTPVGSYLADIAGSPRALVTEETQAREQNRRIITLLSERAHGQAIVVPSETRERALPNQNPAPSLLAYGRQD